MNANAMRWLLSSGLVALGVTGCADPCADDGLIQDDATDCPAVSGGGDSDSDTEGETESESESETVTESESLTNGETDSGGGATCSDGQQNGDEPVSRVHSLLPWLRPVYSS